MNNYKTGFIGCGNMAKAIANGIINAKLLSPSQIYVFDIDSSKCNAISKVNSCNSIAELTQKADVIFLCVKPDQVQSALSEVHSNSDFAMVSIAAGVSSSSIEAALPSSCRVMRIMPNTPMMVQEGAISIEMPSNFHTNEKKFVYKILNELGCIVEVGEDQMDAVTGISGSGPAYVYLFIDALTDAGVANGLHYDDSFKLAVQTFRGAVAMVEQSGSEIKGLIDAVCSPGGTTIEAMQVFKQQDVRGIIHEAVDACILRSKELSD